MKVALELQPCCGQRSGVGIYAYELARHLLPDDAISFYGNIFNLLERHDNCGQLAGITFPIRTCRFLPYSIYRRIWDYSPLSYNHFFPEADITHFFNYIIPPKVKGEVITTIHDMTYLRFPETMDAGNLRRILKGIDYSINRSDLLITVSQFSKREMVELLHVPEKQIEVVPNAASLSNGMASTESIRKKFCLGESPYLLYVGTIEPRKNLIRLIQAFDLLKKELPLTHKLVLAGGLGWNTEEILKTAKQAKASKDIHFTGYITSAEKNSFYHNAELFVFPSIYEGFGIPVLEAMTLGVPVVCSSAASLPEVAGNCAEFVDPFDILSIAQGINTILNNSERRGALIREGFLQAKRFTWISSAEKLKNIYRTLGV